MSLILPNIDINIENIITNLPYPAHLKDPKTSKYLFSNNANLHLYKLQNVEQVIGYTIEDFDSFMKPCWGKNFIEDVKHLEYKATFNNINVEDSRVILTLDGKVMFHYMKKVPIWGKYTDKIIGIFTFSQDFTKQRTLLELYESYKMFYFSKNQAISKFLNHIECSKYFIKFPTESELKILLAKRNFSSNKIIANYFKISPKTVEIYSSNLIKKLKDENLPQLLFILRNLKNY